MEKAGSFQFLCRAAMVQSWDFNTHMVLYPCLQGAQAFPTTLKECVLPVQCL